MLLTEVIRGWLDEVKALGPIFSSQVWSINREAMVWPNTRLSLGRSRWIRDGKNPSMVLKR